MNRNSWPIISLLLLLFISGGCTDDDERGFQSSDKKYMEELKTVLKTSDIPYQEDKDGFIRYQSVHERSVNLIRKKVEKNISGGNAVKFEDKESREFLKGLLSARGMKYRVESREDGEWIRWYPVSESQRREIEMMVVERSFNLQRQNADSQCKGELSPSNKSLNQDARKHRAAISSDLRLRVPHGS